MRILKLFAYLAIAIALPVWFSLSDKIPNNDHDTDINGIFKIMGDSQKENNGTNTNVLEAINNNLTLGIKITRL